MEKQLVEKIRKFEKHLTARMEAIEKDLLNDSLSKIFRTKLEYKLDFLESVLVDYEKLFYVVLNQSDSTA